MLVQFQAIQSVTIPVQAQPLPIQHYLKQPQRLVTALVDPKRVQGLGEGLYRLSMRPINFMAIHVQPVVDLKIWSGHGGALHIKSAGCEIRGNEYINQRFHLTLDGFLLPKETKEEVCLEGTAQLKIEVELPPPLWLTPRPFLETSGNGLLKSVLVTMKQRLTRHLVADYKAWVEDQMGSALALDSKSPRLSSQESSPF